MDGDSVGAGVGLNIRLVYLHVVALVNVLDLYVLVLGDLRPSGIAAIFRLLLDKSVDVSN
jgi:hypothetical protein